ncbi:MAG: class I SAM-dependent methyltransferase [Candidatus Hodarchaeota archaeon]
MKKNEKIESKLRYITRASFDSIADIYDESRTIPDLVIQKALSFVHSKINLRENQVILDAGIGTGKICNPLSKYNVELIGIDISSNMLRKCQKKIKGIFDRKSGLIQGDIMSLPFKGSSFDIVILMHVFFFLKRWEEGIKEIKRILKPGGFLINMDYSTPPRESRIGKKYAELHGKNRSINNFISVSNRLMIDPIFPKIAKLIYRTRFNSIKKSAVSNNEFLIKWTQRLQASQILGVFEKRPYVEYSDTPEKTQRKIMKELKKWIDKESVGHSEEVKCDIEIRIFKF